jgi:peroxiredoxin
MTTLENLPENLPIPTDDGACNHLLGQLIPDISLKSTNNKWVRLREIKGKLVIYCYPMTGRPDVKLPEGWEEIPGARGCTPQACSFRDHYNELQKLNTKVFGLSTQMTDYQREAKERLHLPFDLLSDESLHFSHTLKLPLHHVQGMNLTKRVTLVFNDGVIIKYFYPIFPPDKNIDDVIDWLMETDKKNQKEDPSV